VKVFTRGQACGPYTDKALAGLSHSFVLNDY